MRICKQIMNGNESHTKLKFIIIFPLLYFISYPTIFYFIHCGCTKSVDGSLVHSVNNPSKRILNPWGIIRDKTWTFRIISVESCGLILL